jgi:glycosyltransferase involved in cell wall biosynthesis
MRRPNRVCIVRQGPEDPGNAREWHLLSDHGIEVDVILASEPGRPWRHVDGRIRYYRLPVRRRRAGRLRYLFDYGRFFLLATLLLTTLQVVRRYRVVQVTTMPDALVFAALPAKLLGARVVGFFKEPSPELGRLLFGSPSLERALTRVEQWALRSCDDALTVTAELERLLVARGAEGERITVVANSTRPPSDELLDRARALARTRPRPPGADLILFTHGSVERRYGHDTVVRALHLLRAEGVDARLVFCGSGTAVDDVLELAHDLDLDDRVEYLGFVPELELWARMFTADVGVVSQLSSPYSEVVQTNKMHEYFDAGLPVVASALRSVSAEFGSHRLALYEPGDPESLAKVLLDLARDPALRQELAAESRRLATEVGWTAQGSRYLDVIERAMGGAR